MDKTNKVMSAPESSLTRAQTAAVLWNLAQIQNEPARGGGWNDFARNLRSAYRAALPPDSASFNLGLKEKPATPTPFLFATKQTR